jgi:hypothetical protein
VRDLVDQRYQLSDIVPVRFGQNNRQRDAVGIRDQMMLASQFAPIRGIWASFVSTTGGSDRGAIHDCAIPIDLVSRLEISEQRFKNALPDSGTMPSSQVTQAGVPGGEVGGRWERPPRNARTKHEQDAREDASWVARLPPRKLDMAIPPRLGEEAFDALPQVIGENRSGHDEDLLPWSSPFTS